jgi:hypothetical protein
MSTSIEELSKKIEELVKEHIDASRKAATVALVRAFDAAAVPTKCKRPTKAAMPGRRRTPDELAELGERFYQVLCANPGESMAVLAARVGATSGELHHPVALLVHAGRVRTVGQRRTSITPSARGQTATATVSRRAWPCRPR